MSDVVRRSAATTSRHLPCLTEKSFDNDKNSFNHRFPKDALENGLEHSNRAIVFGGNFFTDKLPVGNFWIVWDKKNTMPTFGDCELAWTNIKRNSVKKYEVQWNGLVGKEKERFHPTQKPVELMGKIINDFSQKKEKILDLFGGSGSTLIACEQLGRRCYMMEISPKYVDVIIERWEKFTGGKAELLRDGM